MRIRRKDCEQHDWGMTLVETVVAIFLMAIMFIGIYAMSIQSLRMVESARLSDTSQQALHAELEWLRSMPWATLTAMGANVTMNATNNPAMRDLPQAQGIDIITPFPTSNSTLKAVSSVVGWKGSYQARQTNRMTTIIVNMPAEL